MQLFSDVFSFFLLGGVVVRTDLGCGVGLGRSGGGKGKRVSGYGLGRRLDVVVARVTVFCVFFHGDFVRVVTVVGWASVGTGSDRDVCGTLRVLEARVRLC